MNKCPCCPSKDEFLNKILLDILHNLELSNLGKTFPCNNRFGSKGCDGKGTYVAQNFHLESSAVTENLDECDVCFHYAASLEKKRKPEWGKSATFQPYRSDLEG